MIFTADLPLPPSSNNMFVNAPGKQGGRFPSGAYKVWKKEAARLLIEQWHAADQPVIGQPYAVHIELNVNHQGDIANREKAITDLLVATIPGFPGDQWVNRMLIERNRDIPAARVEVMTLPKSVGGVQRWSCYSRIRGGIES
jgi:hypothetical protein